MTGAGLRVLVVDDEAPARADLAWLLGREPAVGAVAVAGSAEEALRTLHAEGTDVVFLDVRMPGLHGLDLARVLARFAAPPVVVFVTAHEEHAVEAFELRACDYLLKPVRAERLREALDRVRPSGSHPAGPVGAATAAAPGGEPGLGLCLGLGGDRDRDGATSGGGLATLTVETAGRTRFVARAEVRYAEANGDYTRVHTTGGAHLVRIPLSSLEAEWVAHGYFRIHRSFLVSLAAVSELRATSGTGALVVVDGRELPVSRRQSRLLKEALVRSRDGGRPR